LIRDICSGKKTKGGGGKPTNKVDNDKKGWQGVLKDWTKKKRV